MELEQVINIQTIEFRDMRNIVLVLGSNSIQ